MIRIIIGVALGGTVAMIFPEQAAVAYEFIRDGIHQSANVIADQTNG